MKVSLTVSVSDDGTITFKDENGNPASEALIEAAKKQKADVIRATIQKTCDEINSQVDALENLHLFTPAPNLPPRYDPRPFDIQKPTQPVPKVPGFFAKFFSSKVAQIEADNAKAQSLFESSLRQWESDKATFEAVEAKKRELVTKAVSGDVESMEQFFGVVLQDIVWPRETLVSFEVQDEGKSLVFDVDLPEVEDMPTKTASVPQRGFKLTVKDLSTTRVQKLYATHIHSIGFRLLGEALAMLPTIQKVCLSGYSQRKSKATGNEEDEYLFSVVVSRDSWGRINFKNLEAVDVIEAFTRFELRREMSKSGIFKAVQPFELQEQRL